jgi:hypothetical protein
LSGSIVFATVAHFQPARFRLPWRFTRNMRTVFFSWLSVVAVGLVYMIVIALSGR